MSFKAYYGSSIREALKVAREELGPDAAILASRQTDDGSGRYEVVCGIVPELNKPAEKPAVARRIPAPEKAAGNAAKPPSPAGGSNIRRKLEGVRDALRPSREAPKDSAFDKLWLGLVTDGFDEELANEVITGIRRRARGLELPMALLDELDSRTRIDASLGRGSGKRRVTALVGPPGAGKTTLLVKLAVKYGLTGRRPMRLMTLDASRVGGTDALERYAAGMAAALDVVETGISLAQAIEAQSEAGLILIDTPGLSPSDMPAAQEFLDVLARHPEIDVQLVIPATMSPANMRATFERFRPLLPSRIAITNTDQSVSNRPALGLALRYELPLSFVSTGPAVPEDLQEASVPGLLAPVQGEKARSAVSAA